MNTSSEPSPSARAPILIIFGGLPGTGKTTIARLLARQLGAVYVRIDSIEQAIRDCTGGEPGPGLEEAGYRAGYALAEDNLRLGRDVIADCVNPVAITRDAWGEAARRSNAFSIEVEVICSDAVEHRRRVERRETDIAGLKLPTWNDVTSRDYQAWSRDHIVIDTAAQTPEQNVKRIRELLPAHLRP